MTRIIFSETFLKKLKKLKLSENTITNLISKIPNTKLAIKIDDFANFQVYKWYLNSKKIRIIILLQKVNNTYIPVSIFKKETKQWYNLTKETYQKYCLSDIEKTIADYKSKKFKEIIL